MSQQLVALRKQRDMQKKKMQELPKVQLEIDRMKKMFEQEENFLSYRDEVVRGVVKCIRVMGDKKILVVLKGGYTVEEII